LPEAMSLPAGFGPAAAVMPGIAALAAPPFQAGAENDPAVQRFAEGFPADHPLRAWPLLILCDDAGFVAANLDNFLWTVFTRANPAADVHGIDARTHRKHWGCRGPLVIDARAKPHHAPALVQDPEIVRRVDALAAGPLRGLID
jgi:4-hydroxy-3-polyprenylbenzoate decarboxylase